MSMGAPDEEITEPGARRPCMSVTAEKSNCRKLSEENIPISSVALLSEARVNVPCHPSRTPILVQQGILTLDRLKLPSVILKQRYLDARTTLGSKKDSTSAPMVTSLLYGLDKPPASVTAMSVFCACS